ncbi:MAG TPA: class I SAM-dependent methyltransferase [Gaiellaceae bacterium]|nr:class I SAM-dependent methyltransferase [Gaiellaceae bacterium]
MTAEPTIGRTFGRVAAEYERARPDYPREAIARGAAELGLGPDASVLDLAAGTGKLTRLLRERFAHVVAVEPDDEMRAFVPGDARAGSAESVPAAAGAFDAVFVADAFHWFDADAALRELTRVAVPGGGLALLWNTWWDGQEPPLPPAARALLDDVFTRLSVARRSNQAWQEDVERVTGPLGRAELVTRVPYDRGRMADLLLTTSSPAALDGDARAELRRRLHATLGDGYILTVQTQLYWGRLP